MVESIFRKTPLYGDSVLLGPLFYSLACTEDAPERTIETALTTLKRIHDLGDNTEIFEAVMRLQPGIARQLLVGSLGDELGAVAVLNKQVAILDGSPEPWLTTRVAADALQDIELTRALEQADAGKRASMQIELILRKLDALVEKRTAVPAADPKRCANLFAEADQATPTMAQKQKPKSGCAGCSGSNRSSGPAMLVLFGALLLWRRRASRL